MNCLSLEKKISILSQLVEGCSIRSIERVTGVHRDTIMRVLVEAGEQAREVLNSQLTNLQCQFVQADEIWSYVGKKQKNCTNEEKEHGEVGDQYVYLAMDSETKLVAWYFVGKRNIDNTWQFINELSTRITGRFQLSTDTYRPYKRCVRTNFGKDIDYGTIFKMYDPEPKENRYSPGKIIQIYRTSVIGKPIEDRISTSHVERQNLTMRMQMRRFTRLTNAFSKKKKNLECAVALHFYHYNFMRVHQTLRVTPAMQARVTNRMWNWNDLLSYNSRKIAA